MNALAAIGARVEAQRARGYEDCTAEASADRRVLWDALLAARKLAKSLPDTVLEALRDEWGDANVETIRTWRDRVLAVECGPAPEGMGGSDAGLAPGSQ